MSRLNPLPVEEDKIYSDQYLLSVEHCLGTEDNTQMGGMVIASAAHMCLGDIENTFPVKMHSADSTYTN